MPTVDAMPDGTGHWLLNIHGTVPPDGVVATVTGDDEDGFAMTSDKGAPTGDYPTLEAAVADVDRWLAERG